MERRLGIMQSVEPVLENAIKTLQKVVDVRGMGSAPHAPAAAAPAPAPVTTEAAAAPATTDAAATPAATTEPAAATTEAAATPTPEATAVLLHDNIKDKVKAQIEDDFSPILSLDKKDSSKFTTLTL